MNDEVLHAILSESSEADKQLAINNGLLTKAVKNFSVTVKERENKIGNLKISVPAPDVQPITTELEKYLKKNRSYYHTAVETSIAREAYSSFPGRKSQI